LKPTLTIHTGKETSDEEVEIFKQAFDEQFDVTVDKSIFRLSEEELPLLLVLVLPFATSLLSAVTWDSIKLGTRKLFNTLPPNRAKNTSIKIDVQQGHINKQVIIGQLHIHIINFNEKPNRDGLQYY
jgi:hypothetical protein